MESGDYSGGDYNGGSEIYNIEKGVRKRDVLKMLNGKKSVI